MADIKFETGLVTYNLNGACQLTFNPTDSAFVERLFDTFNELDKKQEAYQEEAKQEAGPKELFALARKRDKEMRAMLDEAFGTPVCDALFGGMNVYALANGLPVWCNLMLAVMDEIDTSFANQQKLTNPRIQKYVQRYQKK